MILPSPRSKLANCVWLPRIWTKAKLVASGELPDSYTPFFCHPKGVDGQFLSFFSLDRDQITSIATLSSSEVELWFEGLPNVDPERIDAWNHMSENFGRDGYPMKEQFERGLADSYSSVAHLNPTSVFEVLEADDKQTIGEQVADDQLPARAESEAK